NQALPEASWEHHGGHRLLLRGRELGRAAQDWPSRQPRGAMLSETGQPTPDRPGGDVEELGDLVGGISFEKPSDGELAPMIQLLGCAFGSRTMECKRTRQRLALLF